jgi:hypothetical protein
MAGDGKNETYLWYHHGTITWVTGDMPAIRDFVEAYLQAAHE